MPLLINIEDIKAYKDLGKKPDIDKITPIIRQAHDDLREYLGANFYFDVIANLGNQTYQLLISGGTFQISNQSYPITYYQEGLKAMLIDLFEARHIAQVNTNITPFGATIKKSNDSEPADRATLQDRAREQIQMAGSKWEIIKMYLDENRKTFKAYNTSLNTIATGERKMRLRKI